MKIGISNPYFDSLGGGERYVLTLASHWSKKHQVTLFWDDPSILYEAQQRLGLDLKNVITKDNFFKHGNFWEKFNKSRKYDLIFFLTDGSIPTSFAKYNILHFQVPFPHINIPYYKFVRFSRVICNSDFTRRNLDSKLSLKSEIIYPPVPVNVNNQHKKQKLILSVGRFSSNKIKKQEILIHTFISMQKKGILPNFRLVFVGGMLQADEKYYQFLKGISKGYEIDFYPNASFTQISRLYDDALLYWHAAGYGESNPVMMEHFGISTVEAMSRGSIPLVFAGGGQSEIIDHKRNGYLWHTPEDLISFTDKVNRNSDIQKIYSQNAIQKSLTFSEKVFQNAIDNLLSSICCG
jgi:O-antigen biosynthesis protein